jgi:hypothetical protein
MCEPKIEFRTFKNIWEKKDSHGCTSRNDMARAFKQCKEKGGCTVTKAKDLAKECTERKSRRR